MLISNYNEYLLVRNLMWKMKNYSESLYNSALLTGEFAYAIGKKLNLSKRDLEKLYISGLLHDIGLISFDKKIFQKENLSLEEENLYKTHTHNAYFMLEDKIEKEIVLLCLNHHRTLDGEGYPKTSTELTLLNQILTTADIAISLVTNENNTQEDISKKLSKYVQQNKLNAKLVEIADSIIKKSENSPFIPLIQI